MHYGVLQYPTKWASQCEACFAQEGLPWEFNLQDITWWSALLSCPSIPQQLRDFFQSVYLHQFHSQHDHQSVNSIFNQVFSTTCDKLEDTPAWTLSATHIHLGHSPTSCKNMGALSCPLHGILKSTVELLADCVAQSWFAIVMGQRNCIKTDVMQALAHFTRKLLFFYLAFL